ncbi:MAG: UDP-N-acetylmuramoyl-tripeptide--D-alanyl-D-alanine ligase [Rhodospirillales bacterium]|nr:UDP-N-acetylmuramoyl-tripeptide--D-alanyl-D-alanine ligase [Rhodospirillales bacterium]
MEMKLWSSTDAAVATGGITTGEWQASGVSIDTRTLRPGDLYIALKGPNVDGHDYVRGAIQAGAAAAVVDHVPEGCAPDLCLIVPDTFKALQDLGRAARARSRAKIIAVTGSVGKTGTKDMLAAVFDPQCLTHASQKSYNNHWGVPLTLASMPLDTEVGIFEIGMNHAGELRPLSKMVRPDIAIITTVEAVHVEYFPEGERGIAAAKAEIFEGMDSAGHAFLNKNNKWFEYLSEKAKEKDVEVIPFSCPSLESGLLRVTPDQTSVTADILGKTAVEIMLPVSGAHHASNALPVLMSVALLGYDLSKALRALEGWTPRDGRGKRERVDMGGGQPPVILIDESYNASPVAMRAAFAALGRLTPEGQGRRIAVLGDMAELGVNAAAYHADLAPDLQMAGVDKVYTAGPLMKHLYDRIPAEQRGLHTDTPPELCESLRADVRPGDIVLVKGSRGGAEKPKMQVIVDVVKRLCEK